MTNTEYDRPCPLHTAVHVVDGVRFVRERDTGFWLPEGRDRRYGVGRDDASMYDDFYTDDRINSWVVLDIKKNIFLGDIFRCLEDAARELLKIADVPR